MDPSDLRVDAWRLENSYGATSNNGNVLGQTITMPKSAGGTLTLTQTYNGVSYDGVNRLKQASESGEGTGWTQSFSYDRYGNLVQSGDGLPPGLSCTAYTASNNRCQGLGYENAGNVVSYATRSLEYDAENRQTSLTDGGTTFHYSYDGEGRRVKKVVGTETTVYVYDASGQLAAEYVEDTNPPPVPPAPPCTTCYLTADHLGSTRVLTDDAGTVQKRYDYFPFGGEIGADLGNRSSVAGYGVEQEGEWFNPKFTAKLRDYESGLNLDYFGARYYAGATGRFLSVDPGNTGARLQDPQSWNGYSYVYNRPLSLTDPDGRCPWCIGAAVGALTDVAIQVTLEGRSLSEIDVGSVAISAAAGAAGVGIATKLTKLGKVARVGLELGSDAAASAAQQVNETGEVSLGTTVLDVSGGKIAGDVAGSIAQKSASSSQGVQLLRKEAGRKTRIANKAEARGNQSSANRRNRQAAAVTQQADGIVARRTAAASVSASQAGSTAVTGTAEEVKRRLEEQKERNRRCRELPLANRTWQPSSNYIASVDTA